MGDKNQTFFAPCPRGLETVLQAELEELGANGIAAAPGGVGFTGAFELCYAVNLHSRIASRVLWQVYGGAYTDEQDLYRAACGVPWLDWFTSRHTIKIKVSAQHCPLKSLDFVTLRIKDAVCDTFRAAGQTRPSVDTSRPDVRVDAFLDEKHVTLYLDTSGEALFKRGLRTAAVEAPLRENLAAGILRLSGWTPNQVLLDPMCGSGTILMEAVLMARNIPPGLGRRFAFEKLAHFKPQVWRALCEAAKTRRTTNAPVSIYGCDVNGRALDAAQANLEAAGLTYTVKLKRADVLDINAPTETGVLVTNPPYGVRLSDDAALAAFYPKLGDALKRRFPGWRAYFFTADLRLPKLIGLAASKRTPLFNGPLECRLFEFKIVRGGNRKNKSGGPIAGTAA
jgi:putative N6-adenine-specific DNA methylase